uniref:CIA30 domain-containing protein n=1 Tax=Steinernema glaseri TaxID=37863 RepID=A0A1I7YH49_9BILA
MANIGIIDCIFLLASVQASLMTLAESDLIPLLKESMKIWHTGCDSDWNEGYSKCELVRSDRNTAIFKGYLNGALIRDGKVERAGWAAMKSEDRMSFNRKKYLARWTSFSHLLIKCRGDGRSYKVMLYTPGAIDITWGDSFAYPLHTHGGPYWQYEKIPFSRFLHTVAGRIQDGQYRINQQNLRYGFTDRIFKTLTIGVWISVLLVLSIFHRYGLSLVYEYNDSAFSLEYNSYKESREVAAVYDVYYYADLSTVVSSFLCYVVVALAVVVQKFRFRSNFKLESHEIRIFAQGLMTFLPGAIYWTLSMIARFQFSTAPVSVNILFSIIPRLVPVLNLLGYLIFNTSAQVMNHTRSIGLIIASVTIVLAALVLPIYIYIVKLFFEKSRLKKYSAFWIMANIGIIDCMFLVAILEACIMTLTQSTVAGVLFETCSSIHIVYEWVLHYLELVLALNRVVMILNIRIKHVDVIFKTLTVCVWITVPVILFLFAHFDLTMEYLYDDNSFIINFWKAGRIGRSIYTVDYYADFSAVIATFCCYLIILVAVILEVSF